jgi:hypothetical protein
MLSKREEKLQQKAITDFHKLDVLTQGEDIIKVIFGAISTGLKIQPTWAFLTIQRVIITDNKVHTVLFSWDLDKIVSLKKTKGNLFIRSNLEFSVNYGEQIKQFVLNPKFGEIEEYNAFFDSVMENRNKLIQIKSSVTGDKTEKVIVEIKQEQKEKAIEILQKRLARGEITLEEFHNIVQRL